MGIPDFALATVLAIAPWSEDVFFAGTDIGVWKSTDAGNTWSMASQGLPDRVAKLLLHGPVGSSRWAVGSRTIHRKELGAHRWEPRFDLGTDHVADLAHSPGHPGELFVSDGRTSSRKIFHTSDDGSSWNTFAAPFRVWGSRMAADRSGRLFVAGVDGLVARTSDGGQTWHTAMAGRGPTTILSDPRRPEVVHLTTAYGYWRSVDGGLSWQVASDGPVGFVIDLTVDPFDPDRLFAINGAGTAVFVSTTNGESWNPAGYIDTSGGMAIAADPGKRDRLLAGTGSGGVSISEDSGVNWTPFNEGLDDLSILDIGFDPATPDEALVSVGGGGL